MYRVYLGGVLCPVAPGKITMKYARNVATIDLANGDEAVVGIGKKACVIEFSLLLPNSVYPFAAYRSGFRNANYFVARFKELLNSDSDLTLLIIKEDQTGEVLGIECTRCLLESLDVIDDAAQGTDVVVNIKLRQYQNYYTKQFYFDASGYGSVSGRAEGNSPAPKAGSVKYRVAKGDCLWMIAKRFYGDGNLFPRIRDANKEVLRGRSPRCLIFVGDELEIPPL